MSEHTGVMIALAVPDPARYALDPASPGVPEGAEVTPAAEMHLTLAYLGAADDIADEQMEAVRDAVRALAETSTAPAALFPASAGVFPPDPDQLTTGDGESLEPATVPFWLAPQPADEIAALREDLLVHLGARGVGELVSTRHPVFNPHVTLAYLPLGSAPLAELPTPVPVEFATLVLAVRGEWEEYPLQRRSDPAAAPPPLTASVERAISHMSSAAPGLSPDLLRAVYLRQRPSLSPVASRADQALLATRRWAEETARSGLAASALPRLDPADLSAVAPRVHALVARAGAEPDPAARALALGRALALASHPSGGRLGADLSARLRALVADGNSSASRSLRARRQLRDRKGRWIEMGGGVRFRVRTPGAGSQWFHGTVEGIDVPNGLVSVRLGDDAGEHAGKLVNVPNGKLEQPKAIIGLFRPKSAGKKPTPAPPRRPWSPDRPVVTGPGAAEAPSDWASFRDWVSGKDRVTFDFEATGLDVEDGTDAPVELAATRVRPDGSTDSFQTLVNPGKPISPEASKVHGITDDMVKDAPTPAEAFEAFREWAGDDEGTLFVAHNANYDVSAMGSVSPEARAWMDGRTVLDTFRLSRAAVPKKDDGGPTESHGLAPMAKAFGVDTGTSHRAGDDAKATSDLLPKILDYAAGHERPADAIADLAKKGEEFQAAWPGYLDELKAFKSGGGQEDMVDPNAPDPDQDAVKALESIFAEVAAKHPDAKVSGGNVVNLVNDANLKAAEEADPGKDEYTFTATRNPIKDEPVTLKSSDVAAVREAITRNAESALPDGYDSLGDEQRKAAARAAAGKAYSTLASKFNERNTDPELKSAPVVKPDEMVEVPEPADDPGDATDPTDQELADAAADALKELKARVPSSSPLAKTRDRVAQSLNTSIERLKSGEDDREDFLRNLDKIKNFANAVEPSWVPPSAKKDQEYEHFSAFAEDLDDVHASAGGQDSFAELRSAASDAESHLQDLSHDPDFEGNVEDALASAQGILKGIDEGEYDDLGALQKDVADLKSELDDLPMDDGARDDLLSQLDAAAAGLHPKEKAELDEPFDPSAPEEQPPAGEQLDPADDAELIKDLGEEFPDGVPPLEDEPDAPAEDYFPEYSPTESVQAAWEARDGLIGEIADAFGGQPPVGKAADALDDLNSTIDAWETLPEDSASLAGYADQVRERAQALADAMAPNHEGDGPNLVAQAGEDFADRVKEAADEAAQSEQPQDAPEAPSESSVAQDFLDFYSRFKELQSGSKADDPIGAAGNAVAAIGKDLAKGDSSSGQAAKDLQKVVDEIDAMYADPAYADALDGTDQGDDLDALRDDLAAFASKLGEGAPADAPSAGDGEDPFTDASVALEAAMAPFDGQKPKGPKGKKALAAFQEQVDQGRDADPAALQQAFDALAGEMAVDAPNKNKKLLTYEPEQVEEFKDAGQSYVDAVKAASGGDAPEAPEAPEAPAPEAAPEPTAWEELGKQAASGGDLEMQLVQESALEKALADLQEQDNPVTLAAAELIKERLAGGGDTLPDDSELLDPADDAEAIAEFADWVSAGGGLDEAQKAELSDLADALHAVAEPDEDDFDAAYDKWSDEVVAGLQENFYANHVFNEMGDGFWDWLSETGLWPDGDAQEVTDALIDYGTEAGMLDELMAEDDPGADDAPGEPQAEAPAAPEPPAGMAVGGATFYNADLDWAGEFNSQGEDEDGEPQDNWNALYGYAGNLSDEINGFLREPEAEGSWVESVKAQIADLDAMMDNSVTAEDTQVYRVVQGDSEADWMKPLAAAEVGDTVYEPGYSSTTKNGMQTTPLYEPPNTWDGKPQTRVNFLVEVPAGTRALDVNALLKGPLGSGAPVEDENELLLDRGMGFEVLDKQVSENGRGIVLRVRAVPAPANQEENADGEAEVPGEPVAPDAAPVGGGDEGAPEGDAGPAEDAGAPAPAEGAEDAGAAGGVDFPPPPRKTWTGKTGETYDMGVDEDAMVELSPYGLTPAHGEAARSYSWNNQGINSALRGDGEPAGHTAEQIELLDELMDASQTKVDMQVDRAVLGKKDDPHMQALLNAQPGDVIHDSAYSGTTVGGYSGGLPYGNVDADARVRLKVNVPAGSRAVLINRASLKLSGKQAPNSHENELLLDREGSFEVVSVEPGEGKTDLVITVNLKQKDWSDEPAAAAEPAAGAEPAGDDAGEPDGAPAGGDAPAAGGAPGFGAGQLGELTDSSQPVHNVNEWTKVGGQLGGGSVGGTYKDADGNLYYVKNPDSPAHAHNEVLHSLLLRDLGIRAAEVELGERNGQLVIVSRWVPGNPEGTDGELNQYMDDQDFVQKAYTGFTADAWMANWDAVGPKQNNIVMGHDEDGNEVPYRIDGGGAMLFSGFGDPKGAKFGPVVTELESMRNPNRSAGKLYHGMTDEQVAEDAKRLATLSPERLRALIDSTGHDQATRDHLFSVLTARQASILSQTGASAPDSPAAPAVDEAVVKADAPKAQAEASLPNPEAVDATVAAETGSEPAKLWVGADGVQLELGHKVVSAKDGLAGTVVSLSANGKYAKVLPAGQEHLPPKERKYVFRFPHTLQQAGPAAQSETPVSDAVADMLDAPPAEVTIDEAPDAPEAAAPAPEVPKSAAPGPVADPGALVFNQVTANNAFPGMVNKKGETLMGKAATTVDGKPGWTATVQTEDGESKTYQWKKYSGIGAWAEPGSAASTESGMPLAADEAQAALDAPEEVASEPEAPATQPIFDQATLDAMEGAGLLQLANAYNGSSPVSKLYSDDQETAFQQYQKVVQTLHGKGDYGPVTEGGLALEAKPGPLAFYSGGHAFHEGEEVVVFTGWDPSTGEAQYAEGTLTQVPGSYGWGVDTGFEVPHQFFDSSDVMTPDAHAQLVEDGAPVKPGFTPPAPAAEEPLAPWEAELLGIPQAGQVTNLGPKYAPLPEGAKPLMQKDDKQGKDTGPVIVQHADGSIKMYTADGKVSTPYAKLATYEKNPTWVSYKPGPSAGQSTPDSGGGQPAPSGDAAAMVDEAKSALASLSDGFDGYYSDDVGDIGASISQLMDLHADGEKDGYEVYQELQQLAEGAKHAKGPDGEEPSLDQYQALLQAVEDWKAATDAANDQGLAAPAQPAAPYAPAPAGALGAVKDAAEPLKGFSTEGIPNLGQHIQALLLEKTGDDLAEALGDAIDLAGNAKNADGDGPEAEVLSALGDAVDKLIGTPSQAGPAGSGLHPANKFADTGGKTMQGAFGADLYVGTQVEATTDGVKGTIVGFSNDGKYAKVQTAGGVKLRYPSKLKYDPAAGGSAAPGAAPEKADVPGGAPIDANNVPTPDPGKIVFDANPDPSSPWYGQPKPDAPAAPETATAKALSGEWFDKVKEQYKAAQGKDLSESKKAATYNQAASGSVTALDVLKNKGWISQDLYDEAKAQIDANLAETQKALDAHAAAMAKHAEDVAAWASANGKGGVVLKGFDHPDVVKLNTSGAWAHMKKYVPKGLTSKQRSAVAAQKSSSSWQTKIRKQLKKLSLKKENVTDQMKNLDSAALAAPPLEEDLVMVRTLTVTSFQAAPGTTVTKANDQDFPKIQGTVQIDWGFPESSPGSLEAGAEPGFQVGNVWMDILMPKGTRGVWTGGESAYGNAGAVGGHSGERGFVAERGLAYYIHKVEWRTDLPGTYGAGKWYVQAEVIPKMGDTGGQDYYDMFVPGQPIDTVVGTPNGLIEGGIAPIPAGLPGGTAPAAPDAGAPAGGGPFGDGIMF